jgi:hypothetical protein
MGTRVADPLADAGTICPNVIASDVTMPASDIQFILPDGDKPTLVEGGADTF